MDRYYTPSRIAKKLVQAVRGEPHSIIADFAVGSGELLKAAKKKWPKHNFVGTDINTHMVKKLALEHPQWNIGKCDFLNANSRNKCKALRRLAKNVSIILLNPPFSCRGGTYKEVEIDDLRIRCGIAIAFILESLPYLKPKGQLVAILPAGCRKNQKDKLAWKIIRRFCRVEMIRENGPKTFKDCYARTVIVRLTRKNVKSNVNLKMNENRRSRELIAGDSKMNIFRGSTQMFSLIEKKGKGSIPFVHTTELRRSRIDLNRYSIAMKNTAIKGPAVLLPRVGTPMKDKVVLYLSPSLLALSDCVFAIRCKNISNAQKVRWSLLKNWDRVKSHFVGTCAKYITIEGLSELLQKLGFQIRDERQLVSVSKNL